MKLRLDRSLVRSASLPAGNLFPRRIVANENLSKQPRQVGFAMRSSFPAWSMTVKNVKDNQNIQTCGCGGDGKVYVGASFES
jgi:hypothetical protein